MSKAKVISFINYKGGVGKTTSAYHVGCCLAGHHKKRVLLVDIDPQTNLTFLCAPVEEWEKVKRKTGTIATMYKRFLDKKPIDTKRYIWRTPILVGSGIRHPNLDLIPCDIDLIGEDLGGGQVAGAYPSMEMLKKNAQQFLRDRRFLSTSIKEVEDDYDYILIDCPPNLYLMTQNALAASDWYVITAIPDHLSTIGLNILVNKAKRIGEMLKAAQVFAGESKTPKMAELGGVIFVKVRIGGSMITNTHASRIADIGGKAENRAFATHTTELIGYSEAAENSLPVWLHQSDNAQRAAGKDEYPNITKEFVKRF